MNLRDENPNFNPASPFAVILSDGSDGWEHKPFSPEEPLIVRLDAVAVRKSQDAEEGGFSAGVAYAFTASNDNDKWVSGYIHVPDELAFSMTQHLFVQSVTIGARDLSGFRTSGENEFSMEVQGCNFVFYEEYVRNKGLYEERLATAKPATKRSLIHFAMEVGVMALAKMRGCSISDVPRQILDIDRMAEEGGWVFVNPDSHTHDALRDMLSILMSANETVTDEEKLAASQRTCQYIFSAIFSSVCPEFSEYVMSGQIDEEEEPEPVDSLSPEDNEWLASLFGSLR